MTDNQPNMNAIAAVMDNIDNKLGLRVIMSLIAGPEHWKNLKSLKLSPEAARAAAVIYRMIRERGLEQDAPKSFLASQAYLAHHAIDSLVAEMEMWAVENDRTDILRTPIQIINEVLPEDERIAE